MCIVTSFSSNQGRQRQADSVYVRQLHPSPPQRYQCSSCFHCEHILHILQNSTYLLSLLIIITCRLVLLHTKACEKLLLDFVHFTIVITFSQSCEQQRTSPSHLKVGGASSQDYSQPYCDWTGVTATPTTSKVLMPWWWCKGLLLTDTLASISRESTQSSIVSICIMLAVACPNTTK